MWAVGSKGATRRRGTRSRAAAATRGERQLVDGGGPDLSPSTFLGRWALGGRTARPGASGTVGAWGVGHQIRGEKASVSRRGGAENPERRPSAGGNMLKNIVLERPLAVIDLETTGTDTKVDRIVEISVLRLLPGGKHDHRTRRVNPGVPIPREATAVHGISDDDVAAMPTFRAIA